MNVAASHVRVPAVRSAGLVLSLILLGLVTAFGCWVVGTRGLDIGTDTWIYAGMFQRLAAGPVETRLEPGFVFLAWLMGKLGFGITGFQAGLFAVLLAGVALAVREMQGMIGARTGYLTLLGAALMLLYVSPMFVNASINGVRQGLAAPLAFAALLAFERRKWAAFILYGAAASSLHVSSLMFLVLAPTLWMKERQLRYVAALAFAAYCVGATLALVRALSPPVYSLVMTYAANSDYRTGVRLDFALFSMLWYVPPLLLAPLVRAEYRERIRRLSSIYLVMLLPFFAIGWGAFSNRFLLPAWLAASLILAAILCHSRLTVLRNPLLLRLGLVAACGVFWYLVNHVIVI